MTDEKRHMKNDDNHNHHGETVVGWDIIEFQRHERSRRWYFYASSVALALLVFSFFTANLLFSVIIIVVAIIIIFTDRQVPGRLHFSINDEGINVGSKFYDYDEIKSFSIVYKPKLEVKNIYFEFNSILQPRLNIPLEDQDPLSIRENLLKYLPEDIERTDLPLSESLARLFKL